MEDKIKANAELVIKQLGPLSGFDREVPFDPGQKGRYKGTPLPGSPVLQDKELRFGYNARSVAWVDGFIEQQRSRSDLDENETNGLVNVLGSFLGECVIRCFGGHWQNEDGKWAVRFDKNNVAYPFHKVRKQFDNGQEDSITKFFELIPVIFKGCLQKPDPSVAPKFPFSSASMPFYQSQGSHPSATKNSMEQLEFFIRQAEDAYSRIYDEWSSSGRAAAYNDCKESMADAIRLARELGLEDKVAELEKKLEHYKEVFRHQMNF